MKVKRPRSYGRKIVWMDARNRPVAVCMISKFLVGSQNFIML
jgi:hypothetical protein